MRISCRLLVTLLFFAGFSGLFGWTVKDEKGELLKIGGYMQYRGRYYDLDFVKGGNQDQKGSLNRHNYYGDISLSFAITPNEYVNAFFEFNKLIFLGQRYRYNTIQTGEEVMPEDLILPDGTTISGTLIPVQNTDEAWEMHLRQAWMDVKFPRAALKLKFGRQPFQLGNGIYTNTNIASVFGYQFYTDLGAGEPLLRFGSMKYYEGVRENYNSELPVPQNDVDDVDLFFGDVSFPSGKSKAGAFVTYFRDNSKNMDVLSHVNLGLTLDLVHSSGWSLNSEFDYQSGSKEYHDNLASLDWTGYAFMIRAGLPPLAAKKLNLSAEFGIGSGDNPDTPNKFEGYVGVGPFYPYAWAYEYRFIHWVHNSSKFFRTYSRGVAENLAPGMENTTYLKGTAVFSLPRKCKFIFSPIWLGMTEKGRITDTTGKVLGTYKTFGWEFDNIFIAPIWPNFSYQFIFAYVQPAEWMKLRGFDDGAYGVRSQLEFTF